ncbi:Hypothetical predicted protein [Octopus vulgaris]|uniref:Uncharacterized protein n=1 Tax=Octopus vulgaris TaxID=6645 RepID=A0AA36BRN7_OCTVU|nr:Hypothetical predicted protein [Octopus vulgaris]
MIGVLSSDINCRISFIGFEVHVCMIVEGEKETVSVDHNPEVLKKACGCEVKKGSSQPSPLDSAMVQDWSKPSL